MALKQTQHPPQAEPWWHLVALLVAAVAFMVAMALIAKQKLAEGDSVAATTTTTTASATQGGTPLVPGDDNGKSALVYASYISFGLLMLADLLLGMRGVRLPKRMKRFTRAYAMVYFSSLVLLLVGSFAAEGGSPALPFIWLAFLAFVVAARLAYHTMFLTIATVMRETVADKVGGRLADTARAGAGFGKRTESKALFNIERFLREARFGLWSLNTEGTEGRLVGRRLGDAAHRAVRGWQKRSKEAARRRLDANRSLEQGAFANMPVHLQNAPAASFKKLV